MKHETIEYEFEHYDSNYMQFVISDRVPNCLLDAMARQEFFEYKLNSKWLSQHLGTNKFKINTARYANAFPHLA